MYLRFPGSLKPSCSISYVLFSSEENYFGALLFHKIPLNSTSYTKPNNTVYFKSHILSVFPSSSDASTHFHIETPSFKINLCPGIELHANIVIRSTAFASFCRF